MRSVVKWNAHRSWAWCTMINKDDNAEMWEDTKLGCYLRFILSSWIFQSALWKQDHGDSPGPFWWSCVSAAAVSMIPSSSLFYWLAKFTVLSASGIDRTTFSTANSLGCASLLFLKGKREARAEKTKKGRCQQFYSTVCIMDNRQGGFKCGEEMRDSPRKEIWSPADAWVGMPSDCFYTFSTCGWMSGSLRASVLQEPAGASEKGYERGLIAATRAQFHILIMSNGA